MHGEVCHVSCLLASFVCQARICAYRSNGSQWTIPPRSCAYSRSYIRAYVGSLSVGFCGWRLDSRSESNIRVCIFFCAVNLLSPYFLSRYRLKTTAQRGLENKGILAMLVPNKLLVITFGLIRYRDGKQSDATTKHISTFTKEF